MTQQYFFLFYRFPHLPVFFYLLKVIFKPLTHLVLVLSFAYTNSINRFFAVLLCLNPVCLVSFMFFRPSFLNIRPINFTLSFPVEDFVSFQFMFSCEYSNCSHLLSILSIQFLSCLQSVFPASTDIKDIRYLCRLHQFCGYFLQRKALLSFRKASFAMRKRLQFPLSVTTKCLQLSECNASDTDLTP